MAKVAKHLKHPNGNLIATSPQKPEDSQTQNQCLEDYYILCLSFSFRNGSLFFGGGNFFIDSLVGLVQDQLLQQGGGMSVRVG